MGRRLKLNNMSHEKFEDCIDACYQCATECKHCENACLDEIHVKDLVRCIKLNSECATMCVLSAKMMAGGSQFAAKLCLLCAEICDACAEECEKHAHMEHCKVCAVTCRSCAEACRQMSAGKAR